MERSGRFEDDAQEAGGFGTSQRSGRELQALFQIASLALTHGHTGFAEVLKVVAEAVFAERALLFLYSEELEEFGVQGGARASAALPLASAGTITRIFDSQVPEIVNDAIGDLDAAHELSEVTHARNLIAAPLTIGESQLGVLAAVNSERGAFGDQDLRDLTVLADRVALALENAELVGKLQRQVRELEGLQRLGQLLTSGDSLERVVQESIRIVLDLMEVERAAILVYDGEKDALVTQPPAAGLTDEQVAGLRISMSEPSLAGMVFRTHTGAYSNDVGNDAWVNPRMRQLLNMENVLIVPLTTGVRPSGILKAMNAKKGYFDDDDLRFLSLMGRQVGAILESSIARQREKDLLRQLKEANRTKSEFVSMLAHELKGPMTTVLGFGHTLEEQWGRLEEDKRREIIGVMAREVSRLARLVNDLLDVTRLEAGTLRYDLEPTDVKEMVDSVLSVHTSLSRAHLIVSDDIPPDLPAAMIDRDRIRQVLINLLTNATRYSPEGTTIRMTANVEGQGPDRAIKVCVIDEGIGISPEDRERVFEKFAMLPKPSWTKKGTGLGLFITKSIIDAHGGRIWVESDPGKGSTFCFTLRPAQLS